MKALLKDGPTQRDLGIREAPAAAAVTLGARVATEVLHVG